MLARVACVLSIIVVALATPGIALAGPVDSPPLCWHNVLGVSLPATKWLTSPGTLIGTSGPDVLVGSTGVDVIKGLGGDDVICSAPTVGIGLADAFGNTVDAGSGNDYVFAYGDIKAGSGNDYVGGVGGTADGGAGNDEILIQLAGSPSPAIAIGGSGNDTVLAFDATSVSGGSGNDNITNETGNPRIDCGSGKDVVVPNGATSVRRCETVPPAP